MCIHIYIYIYLFFLFIYLGRGVPGASENGRETCRETGAQMAGGAAVKFKQLFQPGEKKN